MIDVDDLSDGLSMAAFSSELHVKHRAVDPPKLYFFATKIVAEGFFDNPSAGMLDHHSRPPFV